MKQKYFEWLKNIILIAILTILVFLLVLLPQNRSFQFNSLTKADFLNLGKFLRFSLTPKAEIAKDADGWTNILILGKAGQGNPAPDLTDTLIVFSFKEGHAIFLSIPRDLYIKSPSHRFQKINSLVASGYNFTDIQKIIGQIIGKPIHYTVLGDLSVLKELVDYFNGINVLVPHDIDDKYFPGPNYSYERFQLKKGWRHLDGSTAVKYVRTRHDQEGDFGRIKRQQQVLAALKNKINNLNSLENFSFILRIYNLYKSHVSTNISIAEMKELWSQIRDIDILSSKAFTLSTKHPDLLRGTYINIPNGRMFILLPREGINKYQAFHSYVQSIYNFGNQ